MTCGKGTHEVDLPLAEVLTSTPCPVYLLADPSRAILPKWPGRFSPVCLLVKQLEVHLDTTTQMSALLATQPLQGLALQGDARRNVTRAAWGQTVLVSRQETLPGQIT